MKINILQKNKKKQAHFFPPSNLLLITISLLPKVNMPVTESSLFSGWSLLEEFLESTHYQDDISTSKAWVIRPFHGSTLEHKQPEVACRDQAAHGTASRARRASQRPRPWMSRNSSQESPQAGLPTSSPSVKPWPPWSASVGHSVMSDSAAAWTVARQAPLPVGFSRQEYWSRGGHFLPQRISPAQGLNLSLLHCRQILCCLSHQGSPIWPAWKWKKVKVKLLSRLQLFETPWTVAHQVPLSMGFSRQEYWSGLPFPSPGDLPNPRVEPGSPALQADSLLSEPPGKPRMASLILLKLFSPCDSLTQKPLMGSQFFENKVKVTSPIQ